MMSEIETLIRSHGGRSVGETEALVLRRRSRKLVTVGVHAAGLDVVLSQATKTHGGEIVARILDWARDRVEHATFPSREAANAFIADIAPRTQRTVIDEQAPPGALEIALF
jgi:hypothetical protein